MPKRLQDHKRRALALRPRLEWGYFPGFPLLLSAFMLGRATILGSIAPFGLAAYAATRSTLPARAPAVFLAISLGQLTLGLNPDAVFRISLLLAYAAMLASARFRGPVASALGAFGLVLVARGGLILLSSGVDLYLLILTGFEAVLAGLLVIIFSYGLPVIAHQETGNRGWRRTTPEELSCAVAFLVAIMAGVGQASLGPLMLKNMAAAFLTMGLGLAGGIGLGAAAGATCGVISGLPTGLLPQAAGIFALGGLLGGAFRILGKAGVVVGFLLGSLGLVLQVTPPHILAVTVVEYSLASLIFLLVPAQFFEGIAQRMATSRAPVTAESLQLRASVAQRLEDLGQALREVGQVVDQTSAARPDDLDGGQRHAFTRLATYICHRCAPEGTCRVTGEAVFDWLVLAELNNGIRKEHLPREVRLRCNHSQDIMQATNHLLELARFSHSWQRRVEESRQLVCSQTMSLAGVLDRMAMNLLDNGAPPRESPAQTIGFEAGIARMNKEGSIISGDSFLARELSEERLLVVLSDGMGSGPRAAMESRAVVSLLEKLLTSGLDREATIKLINSVLLFRADAEVSPATIDLLLLDKTSGKGEFVKIGAMPSFLRRGEEFSLIEGNGLPVGVTHQFDIEVVERFLVPGDILVMTTDGLFSGLRQGASSYNWLAAAMGRARSHHPKEIAETLLERSLGHRHDPPDDISVIVLRLVAHRGVTGSLRG